MLDICAGMQTDVKLYIGILSFEIEASFISKVKQKQLFPFVYLLQNKSRPPQTLDLLSNQIQPNPSSKSDAMRSWPESLKLNFGRQIENQLVE